MDWSAIAPLLGQFGLPILRSAILAGVGAIPVIGPIAGPFVADAVGAVIARQLGVAPTPEAVKTAIETGDHDEVLARLQAAQAEAVAKWPALAEVAKAEEETARAQITTTADVMKTEILAATTIAPGRWRTFVQVVDTVWRPLFALELLVECAYLFFGLITSILWAVAQNQYGDIDALIRLMPLWSVLVLPYLAMRCGLLGYHMNLRTREKESVNEMVAEKPVAMDDIKALLRAAGVKVK